MMAVIPALCFLTLITSISCQPPISSPGRPNSLFFSNPDNGFPPIMAANCGGPVTAFPANFSSPNYPGRYPRNSICTWEFAAFPGKKLVLTFTSFSLGMTPQCREEYVEVVDYDATTTYCGHDIPAKVVSQYNRLIVNFRSDANGDEGLYFAGHVDQVANSQNPCYPNPCENGATCIETFDTPEFYVCHCPPGYVGKNCSCIDRPCAREAACGSQARCMDTCQGAVCICDDGYFKRGQECLDVDECSFFSPCSPSATCTNTPGSFTCKCKPGYFGDGVTCELINECPSGWTTYPGADSCYKFSDKNATWTQARAACNAEHASLVCVDSTEEMHFLGLQATDGNFHWLSHNDADQEGVFACTNGNYGMQPYPWDEHDQEPDGGNAQNCLILYSSFKWGWTNCTSSHSSVCELKSRPCPFDWQSYPAIPGSCYRFIDSFMGFDAARANCRSLHPQADLIVIDSVIESKFVRDTIPRWIGVKRPRGSSSDWRTVAGRKMFYENWAHPPPAPNQDDDLCGVLIKSTWNDAECQSSYHYICEKPFSVQLYD